MKVHNLQVTSSLISNGENLSFISSSVAATNLSQDNRISSLEGAAISGTTITRLNSLETTTGSLNTFTSSASSRLNSIENVTGSYATTGSNQFKNDQVITGSLTVTGFIDAQELRTTYISSSILYRSGSTKFGDELTDNHTFTGSMLISGSVTTTGNVGVGVTTSLSKFHVNTGTNQNFRVRPGTDVGATNGIALNSRTDDDGSLQQLTLRASDVIMLTSGNVGIGTASPTKILEVAKAEQNNQIILTESSDSGDDTALFYARRSRGTSLTSPTAIQSLNNIGGLALGAYNGSAFAIGAKVKAITSQNWTTSAQGTNLIFETTGDNSTTLSERMRITSGGHVGIKITPNSGWGSSMTALQLGTGGVLSNWTGANNNFGVGVNYYDNGSGSQLRLYTGGVSNISFNEDAITFSNAASSSAGTSITFNTRLTITSSGNVGIGTNNPGQKLEVVGGEIKAGRVDSSNEGGQVSFGRASDNATAWYIDAYGSTSSPSLRFVNVTDSAVVMSLSGSIASIGASYMTYPLNIEAMSGGGQLALTRSGAVAEFYMGGTTGGGTQLYVRSGGSGGVRLDAGSTAWVSASDIRLKDIEKPIENAVENLSSLQTVYYSWKNSDNKSLHLGLIAQEVEAVFPEIVSESSIDEMKGVTYTELIPVLVKAIQEQQTQIEFLKSEIETLKQ